MEVSTGTRYTGTMVSVKDGKFGFIKMDGMVPDIFVHRDECGGRLPQVGQMLSFSVVLDPQRPGAYRAKEVRLVIDQALDPEQDRRVTVSGAQLLSVVMATTTTTVTRMKEVPADLLAQVPKNEPFKGLPRTEESIKIPADREVVHEILTFFLAGRYGQLQAIGLDLSLRCKDEKRNEAAYRRALEEYRELGMGQQCHLLDQQYGCFLQARRLLAWMFINEFFQVGTPFDASILKVVVESAEFLTAYRQKEKWVNDFQRVVTFMRTHGLLRSNSLVPMANLPELFMAAPVWYHACGMEETAKSYFCRLFPCAPWLDIFQTYNDRFRTMRIYKGEHIPPEIRKVMAEAKAKEVFDYVVVMTPYHDVITEELKRPEWKRPVDPYVVGFKEGMPFFCLLGRYSGSGLFPLHAELLADTINFLRTTRSGFLVLNRPGRSWSECGRDGTVFTRISDRVGDRIIASIDAILLAFEQGILFDFLRGQAMPEVPDLGGLSETVSGPEPKQHLSRWNPFNWFRR